MALPKFSFNVISQEEFDARLKERAVAATTAALPVQPPRRFSAPVGVVSKIKKKSDPTFSSIIQRDAEEGCTVGATTASLHTAQSMSPHACHAHVAPFKFTGIQKRVIPMLEKKDHLPTSSHDSHLHGAQVNPVRSVDAHYP
jgi:hypothetical protein